MPRFTGTFSIKHGVRIGHGELAVPAGPGGKILETSRGKERNSRPWPQTRRGRSTLSPTRRRAARFRPRVRFCVSRQAELRLRWGKRKTARGVPGGARAEPEKHAPVPAGHAGWSVGDTSPNSPRLTPALPDAAMHPPNFETWSTLFFKRFSSMLRRALGRQHGGESSGPQGVHFVALRVRIYYFGGLRGAR